MELNFTENDISKCIDQVKTELASLLSEKGISLKIDNTLKGQYFNF
jgi:hypothetical protein